MLHLELKEKIQDNLPSQVSYFNHIYKDSFSETSNIYRFQAFRPDIFGGHYLAYYHYSACHSKRDNLQSDKEIYRWW